MKRYITALAVAAILTACNSDNDIIPDNTPVKMTFAISGDFHLDTHDFTRSLEADGKTMTDVWVLDYVGGELKQQLHQTSDDADFGSPTMDLSLGTHHIYFIASRGAGASLNTTTHALTFTSVRDTFWKDYEVDVVSTSNGNRAVTLERVVAKLKLTVNDEIPAGAATLVCTPVTWYYGLNYRTGVPVTATNAQAISISIPANYVGTSGQLVASFFTISGTDEWTTDVSVAVKDGNGVSLGSAIINDAPMLRNRSTEYSGNLFSGVGNMVVSINGDWASPYIGTW